MKQEELRDLRVFRQKVLCTAQKQIVRGRSQAGSQTHSEVGLHNHLLGLLF